MNRILSAAREAWKRLAAKSSAIPVSSHRTVAGSGARTSSARHTFLTIASTLCVTGMCYAAYHYWHRHLPGKPTVRAAVENGVGQRALPDASTPAVTTDVEFGPDRASQHPGIAPE